METGITHVTVSQLSRIDKLSPRESKAKFSFKGSAERMYLWLSTTARQRRFARPDMKILQPTAATLAAKSDNTAISPFPAYTKPAPPSPPANPKPPSESSSARSSASTSPREKPQPKNHPPHHHHPITPPRALPPLQTPSKQFPRNPNQHATSSTKQPATTKHGPKFTTAAASSTTTSYSTTPLLTSFPNSAQERGIERQERSEKWTIIV